ncbi:hypothetical protein ACA910_007582 [Epithemia clementina (nom. ined.)]
MSFASLFTIPSLQLQDRCSTSEWLVATNFLPLFAVLLLTTVLWYSYNKSHQSNSTFDTNKLPPKVKDSFWTVLKQFFSPTVPQYLLQLSREQGPILRLPLAPPGQSLICVSDYRVARQILEHPQSTKWPHSYQLFAQAFGGPNFFTLEDDRYKHTRRNHSAALGPQYMEQTGNAIILQCIDDWMQEQHLLSTENDTTVVIDISRELQVLMARIITKVAFDYHDMSRSDLELCVNAIFIIYQEVFVESQKNPLRRLLPFLFPQKMRALQATQDLQRYCRLMMESFRQRLLLQQQQQHQPPPSGMDKSRNQNNTGSSNQQEQAPVNRNCLLALVLQDEGYASDQERCVDLVAYFAGGFETSGYTAMWALLEIARHPDIQDELRNALKKAATQGTDAAAPSCSPSSCYWKHCEFLHHVVKEAMRLHPVAAGGSIRVLAQDLTTPQGYVIPKGSVALMPFYCIQRNRNVYTEQPDEFCPHRWNEDPSSVGNEDHDNKNDKTSQSKPNMEAMKQSWMSFSLGRRNCKGQLLALTELHMLLARLIVNYEWSVVEEGQVQYAVTLKTMGTKLQARKRRTLFRPPHTNKSMKSKSKEG